MIISVTEVAEGRTADEVDGIIDLEVDEGEFVYLIGRVGTGKSTLLKTLYAEVEPASGSAEVVGFDLCNLKRRQIPELRRAMGIVFQDFQLLMDRSVEDNLKFVLRATGWKDEDKMDDRIKEVLEAVGMGLKSHKMPFQLSGGEQQRVAIARSLLNEPSVIIADEPTGNLDTETADGILRLLTKINIEKGTAVVMVTHNRQVFEKYPGRVFVCKGERCVEEGQEAVLDMEIAI